MPIAWGLRPGVPRVGARTARRTRPVGPRCLVALALACLPLPAPLAAFQTLQGRVVEEGRDVPVPGAQVTLLDRGGDRRARALADSLGRFTLAPPEAGEYVIEVVRVGYETTRSPLLGMGTEGTAAVDLEMRPVPIGLEGLEVTVEREASDLLRRIGHTPLSLGARWIDRAEIERRRTALRPSDVIRWQAIPGLYLPVTNTSPSLEPLCVTTQRAGTVRSAIPPCAITLLNGVKIDPVEVNQLGPDDIEAIAVLSPVDATTLYGTDGGAGAVLIWTRRGR
jgi:hypothetical protein